MIYFPAVSVFGGIAVGVTINVCSAMIQPPDSRVGPVDGLCLVPDRLNRCVIEVISLPGCTWLTCSRRIHD